MTEKVMASGCKEDHRKRQMAIVSIPFLNWPDAYASRKYHHLLNVVLYYFVVTMISILENGGHLLLSKLTMWKSTCVIQKTCVQPPHGHPQGNYN